MRTLVILATVLIFATAVNAVADEPKLETEEQKTLYALGLTINRSLSPFNLSPSELELVEAALGDGGALKNPEARPVTDGPKIKQVPEAVRPGRAPSPEKAGHDPVGEEGAEA